MCTPRVRSVCNNQRTRCFVPQKALNGCRNKVLRNAIWTAWNVFNSASSLCGCKCGYTLGKKEERSMEMGKMGNGKMENGEWRRGNVGDRISSISEWLFQTCFCNALAADGNGNAPPARSMNHGVRFADFFLSSPRHFATACFVRPKLLGPYVHARFWMGLIYWPAHSGGTSGSSSLIRSERSARMSRLCLTGVLFLGLWMHPASKLCI